MIKRFEVCSDCNGTLYLTHIREDLPYPSGNFLELNNAPIVLAADYDAELATLRAQNDNLQSRLAQERERADALATAFETVQAAMKEE